ncbi:MAG: NAD(P)/FAD-dependent oxidoreductase, partial [Candidatus Absconditabacterales bacterium]
FVLKPGDTLRDFRVKALRPLGEAKVSVGGIILSEFDQHFQSKKIPGLYFIGEALDITGKTGGYNLQWAWSSAFCCAKGMNN